MQSRGLLFHLNPLTPLGQTCRVSNQHPRLVDQIFQPIPERFSLEPGERILAQHRDDILPHSHQVFGANGPTQTIAQDRQEGFCGLRMDIRGEGCERLFSQGAIEADLGQCIDDHAVSIRGRLLDWLPGTRRREARFRATDQGIEAAARLPDDHFRGERHPGRYRLALHAF